MIDSRLLFAALAIAGSPLAAQEAAPEAPLSVALDAADQVETACRLTFVARNEAEAGVEALVIETVAFDLDGGVSRIALFDFGALPAGLPRVRQFDLPDTDCAALSSLLVNGVQTCEGGEACEMPPSVSSRIDLELLG
ncbi:hypothetical protein EU805_03665 [Salipiger sp. IMCC34102]|uniref:hypothetical protein n=1 Tax=Salipiger sp. IMCC34102 TaxID=2510647 RepID=UPI00101C753E|nr:hypothetical protein [Salipiger sp. IMCC34102]RYH04472.1 hypothetical protein EU805_03665 [Salipiger sp. IMCC34102]